MALGLDDLERLEAPSLAAQVVGAATVLGYNGLCLDSLRF